MTTSPSTQQEKARAFAALHTAGKPLILYNIWDAGSAKVVAEAGANALATGSWSVASAQGYADGERMPLDAVALCVSQICAAVSLPVSIDFEGAYATDTTAIAANAQRIMDAGAIGINFEDQIVGGAGLHPIEVQCERIRAIRAQAEAFGLPFFINARTDLFLKAASADLHAGLLDEVEARGKAYQAAGASGLFVPGLMEPALIEKVCAASKLPVNVMVRPGMVDNKALAALGVSRISYGPGSYRALMQNLKDAATAAFA
jgi:2-methylisocitrate lyase-like PEP mutase family enzyme